ncbi:UTP--glucose-1-phosphate uridylyltransferase GalU [Deferribacter autotrophicus]|uniref:UTP--glucose-1-phosphate uridylyltransferase n=1 Tax=Deferribacter autotrophicus TaxID=500465 RepID=A0A5A8F6H0_9BACT|nr:UTP--glucose-1-phosphate uridylyltransferase GalU [Deferribacter autotrophicus]KAA0258409.1 UTP--glucose-1-phosphate uridylyltransferase GalU [Deferribacter autotrophicus]
MKKIRKAVLPVAGFGTRMLPASKAIPKEMITLVDKPLIQYAVEEAINSGIETIIFVTSRHKKPIEDHFDRFFDLEETLSRSGKEEELKKIMYLANCCEFISVRQKEQRGLGDAVYCAKSIVGDEPFAVILPDDVILSKEPVIGQLIEQYNEMGGSVIALQEVAPENTSKYGIVSIEEEINDRLFKLNDMVEKPRENPPSNFAIIGRYVLTSAVMENIGNIESGALGEIQLTDAIKKEAEKGLVYGYKFKGERFDCGNVKGYIEATLNFALERDDLRDYVVELIKNKFI